MDSPEGIRVKGIGESGNGPAGAGGGGQGGKPRGLVTAIKNIIKGHYLPCETIATS
jgi:hypothetical protein